MRHGLTREEWKRAELKILLGVVIAVTVVSMGLVAFGTPQSFGYVFLSPPTYVNPFAPSTPNAFVLNPAVNPTAPATVSGIGSMQRYCTNPTTPEGSCSSTHKYCQPGQLRLICDCNVCPALLGSGSPCESFCNGGQTAQP